MLWANKRNYQREPECQAGTLLNKDCNSSGLYPKVCCICRKLTLTYKLLKGVFGMKDIDFMCFEKRNRFPQEEVTVYVAGKNLCLV